MRVFPRLASIVPVVLLMAACRGGPPREAAIGEAFVGPSSLNIRKELSLKSPVTAALRHGERVEILQTRRRFVRIRTAKDVEGWTHERALLSPKEMQGLQQLSRNAAHLHSHGAATTYGPLNVHTAPNRQAPSFHQIQEGTSVNMLRHQLVPRDAPPPPKELLTPRRRVARPKPPRKKRESSSPVPLPPPPKAPQPPDDWLEQSGWIEGRAPERPEPEEPPEAAARPARDEWTLIRTSEGFSGWVLRNRLALSIPDEILQYAEGKRITSYFKIGETRDKDGPKTVWLWTTVDRRASDADFDTIRVFVWNSRRHRYETGLIERNWKGLFPITVGPVPPPKSIRGAMGTVPGFVVQGEKADGRRVRRSYALVIDRIRLSIEQPLPASEPVSGAR